MPKKVIHNTSENASLCRQIVSYFTSAIDEGQFREGELLPSTRALSQQFGVSRDTVVRAYEELVRLRLITSASTRGYLVKAADQSADTERAPKAPSDARLNRRFSSFGESVRDKSARFPVSADFNLLNYNGPPSHLLPAKRWRLYMQENAEHIEQLNCHPEVLGRSELRRAVASYLGRSKQISCSERHVVIFSSTFAALNLLLRLLLEEGDVVAVEDPGFGGIRNIARAQKLEILGIPVDAEGMAVHELPRGRGIKLIYVSPWHQEPTAVTMSARRREELLAWARENDCWIVEDDHDGHFHFLEAALPALKAQDGEDNVIYLSTFWRLLYPLTSMGFCLLPKDIAPLVHNSKIEVEGVSETLPQLALAQMLDDGYLERYKRRLTKNYAICREAAMKACHQSLSDIAHFTWPNTGTYGLLHFGDISEELIQLAAGELSLPLVSSAHYYFEDTRPSKTPYIFDFSCMNEADIEPKLASLAEKLKADTNPDSSQPSPSFKS